MYTYVPYSTITTEVTLGRTGLYVYHLGLVHRSRALLRYALFAASANAVGKPVKSMLRFEYTRRRW